MKRKEGAGKNYKKQKNLNLARLPISATWANLTTNDLCRKCRFEVDIV